MPSINSIAFDLPDCRELEASPEQIDWIVEASKAFLTLHYFAKAPDLPAPLTNIELIRDAYRQQAAQAGGGVISIEPLEIQKLLLLELIFKFPQEPQGMTYIGSLTLPFAALSYVIKIQCEELGVTGLREALIVNQFMESGQLALDAEKGVVLGWAADPYKKDYQGPCLRNRAEAEIYDRDFPEHPLSRLRDLLSKIKSTLKFDKELYSLKAFC